MRPSALGDNLILAQGNTAERASILRSLKLEMAAQCAAEERFVYVPLSAQA